MSEKDVSEGKIVIASVGTIIWRERLGEIEVLTGIRQNEPWAGCKIVVFGGLVNTNDDDIKSTAIRETKEETDISIKKGDLMDVGVYGPKAFHHTIMLTKRGDFRATPTDEEISSKYKFVMTAFAAKYKKGKPKDNREIKYLKFVRLLELAKTQSKLAFDQGKILEDFYKITNLFDRDPFLKT